MRELNGHLKGKETKSRRGEEWLFFSLFITPTYDFLFFFCFFCLVSARGRTSNKRLQNYPGATWLQGHWHPHMIFYPIFYSIQILFIYLFIYYFSHFSNTSTFFSSIVAKCYLGDVYGTNVGLFLGGSLPKLVSVRTSFDLDPTQEWIQAHVAPTMNL